MSMSLQTLQLHVLGKTAQSLVHQCLRETLKLFDSKVKQLSESKVEVEQVFACCLSSPGRLLS
jgi:hypothetical protein